MYPQSCIKCSALRCSTGKFYTFTGDTPKADNEANLVFMKFPTCEELLLTGSRKISMSFINLIKEMVEFVS